MTPDPTPNTAAATSPSGRVSAEEQQAELHDYLEKFATKESDNRYSDVDPDMFKTLTALGYFNPGVSFPSGVTQQDVVSFIADWPEYLTASVLVTEEGSTAPTSSAYCVHTFEIRTSVSPDRVPDILMEEIDQRVASGEFGSLIKREDTVLVRIFSS